MFNYAVRRTCLKKKKEKENEKEKGKKKGEKRKGKEKEKEKEKGLPSQGPPTGFPEKALEAPSKFSKLFKFREVIMALHGRECKLVGMILRFTESFCQNPRAKINISLAANP